VRQVIRGVPKAKQIYVSSPYPSRLPSRVNAAISTEPDPIRPTTGSAATSAPSDVEYEIRFPGGGGFGSWRQLLVLRWRLTAKAGRKTSWSSSRTPACGRSATRHGPYGCAGHACKLAGARSAGCRVAAGGRLRPLALALSHAGFSEALRVRGERVWTIEHQQEGDRSLSRIMVHDRARPSDPGAPVAAFLTNRLPPGASGATANSPRSHRAAGLAINRRRDRSDHRRRPGRHAARPSQGARAGAASRNGDRRHRSPLR